MPSEFDLFGKTFDQQVDAAGNGVANLDIAPNTRIAAEVVFEPLVNGVRVTARDGNHRMLWGFIGSQGMLDQAHCPVAVYDALEGLLTEEVKEHGFPVTGHDEDKIATAMRLIADLERTTTALKKSLDVKKITPATVTRAIGVAQAVNDANRQIMLETNLGHSEKGPGTVVG